MPVVSRWKCGFSEGGRVSNGCFEDDGVSIGWEFDMTVGVQVFGAYDSPHVSRSLNVPIVCNTFDSYETSRYRAQGFS